MKVLITGGFGFIGSYFVEQALDLGWQVVILDKLTYATDFNFNRRTGDNIFRSGDVVRYHGFYLNDISKKDGLFKILNKEKPDYIVNFAAESHVDRSLKNDDVFYKTNVDGVKNFLDYMKQNKGVVKRFLQVSTDEVGGEWPIGSFTEVDKRKPRNPYSATKAMAEVLCEAYSENFDLPVIITRGSNTYGPRQYPEKLIPLFTLNLLQDKSCGIYDGGTQIRDWLHAYDHASGIMHALQYGNVKEIYHIGGENEKQNIEVIDILFQTLNKSDSLKDWTASRLGHDSRYSLNCDKLKNIGWQRKMIWDNEILNTVQFYVDNLEKYVS